MTKQSMEERFDEKFIGCGDAFCSKHQFRGQVDGRVGENLPEHLKQFISQEIERARQEVVSEVVEMMKSKTVSDVCPDWDNGDPQWWNDNHIGFNNAIEFFEGELKKKYNLE